MSHRKAHKAIKSQKSGSYQDENRSGSITTKKNLVNRDNDNGNMTRKAGKRIESVPPWFYAFIIFIIVVVLKAGASINYDKTPENITSTAISTNTPLFTNTAISTNSPTTTITTTIVVTSTATPIVPTVESTLSLIELEVVSSNLYCEYKNQLPYILINLVPEGGVYPYFYETQTSSFVKRQGIVHEKETINLTLLYGRPIILRVRSGNNLTLKWDWEGIVSRPITGNPCTLPTKTHNPPDPTHIIPVSTTMTPIPTTATPGTITITSKPTTVTPQLITITPKPTTVTPQLITITPKPTTVTPKPPIVTPTIVPPSAKQCEDGIDNDGDGYTDFPADPQCKSPSDNQEKN